MIYETQKIKIKAPAMPRLLFLFSKLISWPDAAAR